MVKEVRLPDLGEGIEGADVSEVVVSVGDTVSKDDTLLVLESDKASMAVSYTHLTLPTIRMV